jgi:hypothetical protein
MYQTREIVNMKLQEHIRKVLREEYLKPKKDNTGVEKRINRVMSKKFPWWKNITIEDFRFGEENSYLSLYGIVEVDKEWAKERWPYMQIGGKNAYERWFRDIFSREFTKEISDYLILLLPSLTEYSVIDYLHLGSLRVKFV